jgi:hypothetical protein
MHKRAKFTLGTIDGWHQTAKSGRMFSFTFKVNGTQYGGSSGWESGMKEADGSRCRVGYDSLDPQAERRPLRHPHPRQHPPSPSQWLAGATISCSAVAFAAETLASLSNH